MPKQIFTVEVEYPLLDEDGDPMSDPASWGWVEYQEHYRECEGAYSEINTFRVIQASAVTYSDADEQMAVDQGTSLLEMEIHR